MSRLQLTLLLSMAMITPSILADDFNSVQDGDWEETATWGGSIPDGNDIVYIEAGHNVLITNPNLTYSENMIIVVRGSLEFDDGKLNLPEGSTLIIEDGGVVYGDGGGNNDKIRIGNTGVWTTNDGPQYGYLVWGEPVELEAEAMEFDVSVEGSTVHLAWNAVKIEKGQYFEVLQSKDGEYFHSLAHMEARTDVYHYTYKGEIYDPGFYRLLHIGADHKVIAVSSTKKINRVFSSRKIRVFPNPSAGGYFQLEGLSDDVKAVRLIDTKGKEIPLALSSVDSGKMASNTSIPSGQYVLAVLTGTEMIYRRLSVR